MKPLLAAWLGRVPYRPTYELQRLVAELRAEGKMPDVLLLLEHEPVYTLGRRGTAGEILLDSHELGERGIEVVETDRGGRVTYHGPGQLVGYPILDLGPAADLVAYVRTLERALIGVADDFGVAAGTLEGHTGVWVGDSKLAAIGVHVSRGITTHGFALNVSTDLGAFNGIIPCGIVDKGVTSLEALTGGDVELSEVVASAATRIGEALGMAPALVEMSLGEVVHA
jgi:lipoate-protein ligase B